MIWKKKKQNKNHNFTKVNIQVYTVLLDYYKGIYNFMFNVFNAKGSICSRCEMHKILLWDLFEL